MSTKTAAPTDGHKAADEELLHPETQVYEPHRVGLPPMGAYVREAWRRREFARELSRTNLRAQHFNTLFGQLWLLINPLLLAGVYFVLVDIIRQGSGGERFLAHLVCCIFAYYLVQQALTHGVKSVTSGGRLILNSAFPRVLLPLASVRTAYARFLPTLLVYVPIFFVTDRPIGPELLWLPVLMLLLTGVALGLTVLVSAAQVYFRDLRNFLPYALRLWLYTSPILYFADEVPARYEILLHLNPLGSILTAWSDVLVDGRSPSAFDLGLGLAWAVGLMLAGILFFVSREREFAVRL